MRNQISKFVFIVNQKLPLNTVQPKQDCVNFNELGQIPSIAKSFHFSFGYFIPPPGLSMCVLCTDMSMSLSISVECMALDVGYKNSNKKVTFKLFIGEN